jgi:hypothetical protein
MILVAHRRNTVEQLRETQVGFGIEVDIRSKGEQLIIHHDPFADGADFEKWIKHYRHRLLILNTKEEGLEQRLLSIMTAHGIADFFFLDQSFPFLIKTARNGESRCAVRLSEFETIETVMSLAGLVRWVWVDCFSRFPLTGAQATQLKAAGFALCLVSPELQGRTDPAEIAAMRALLDREGIVPEAVCTKTLSLWR